MHYILFGKKCSEDKKVFVFPVLVVLTTNFVAAINLDPQRAFPQDISTCEQI